VPQGTLVTHPQKIIRAPAWAHGKFMHRFLANQVPCAPSGCYDREGLFPRVKPTLVHPSLSPLSPTGTKSQNPNPYKHWTLGHSSESATGTPRGPCPRWNPIFLIFPGSSCFFALHCIAGWLVFLSARCGFADHHDEIALFFVCCAFRLGWSAILLCQQVGGSSAQADLSSAQGLILVSFSPTKKTLPS